MPLVNRTTNLKSLRYGSDRRNQGSSNQPYVTTPIPNGEGPGLGDVDFLLRGGSLLPASVVNDVSRLTQMMFDFKSPNGLLFTVKQNALSRSAVNQMAVANNSSVVNLGKNSNRLPLNNGIYLPTSTLAQAAVNPLGGHLLKQGINPFASTNDVANGNSLSTGFGGFLPLSQPIYLDTIAQNERQNSNEPGTSRLIQFTNAFIKDGGTVDEILLADGTVTSYIGLGTHTHANKSVLDMGSGTGVLAILAAKLGATSLIGIDFDEWAYENAVENAEINAISTISFINGDTNAIGDATFDIILANINRNIILQDIATYVKAMNTKSEIIFSGFLKEDIPLILEKSEQLGLELVASKHKNRWQMLHLKKA